jgi:hypothetical protein
MTISQRAVAAPGIDRNRDGGKWSGRLDSNQRPSAPKADALPGCATPRRLDSSNFTAFPSFANGLFDSWRKRSRNLIAVAACSHPAPPMTVNWSQPAGPVSCFPFHRSDFSSPRGAVLAERHRFIGRLFCAQACRMLTDRDSQIRKYRIAARRLVGTQARSDTPGAQAPHSDGAQVRIGASESGFYQAARGKLAERFTNEREADGT